jgi:hypothetical protein
VAISISVIVSISGCVSPDSQGLEWEESLESYWRISPSLELEKMDFSENATGDHLVFQSSMDSASSLIELPGCDCRETGYGVIVSFINENGTLAEGTGWVAIQLLWLGESEMHPVDSSKGNLGQTFVGLAGGIETGPMRLSAGDFPSPGGNVDHVHALIVHKLPVDAIEVQVNFVKLAPPGFSEEPSVAVQHEEIAHAPVKADILAARAGGSLLYAAELDAWTFAHLPEGVVNVNFNSTAEQEPDPVLRIESTYEMEGVTEFFQDGWALAYFDYRVISGVGDWAVEGIFDGEHFSHGGVFKKGYITGSPTELLGQDHHPQFELEGASSEPISMKISLNGLVEAGHNFMFRVIHSSINPHNFID